MATDDEAAGFVRLQAIDPLLELLHPHQRFVGKSEELLARAGERHARSQADQQLGPEALFELFDDRRQARLADLKHARGGGKTPAPRDGLKVAQMVQHAPPAWSRPAPRTGLRRPPASDRRGPPLERRRASSSTC